MKSDRLGNQQGVQTAASCGTPYMFFIFHFTIHFQRDPALYRETNINGDTEGGGRQGQDDTENVEVFIASTIRTKENSQGVSRKFCFADFSSRHIRHTSNFCVLVKSQM